VGDAIAAQSVQRTTADEPEQTGGQRGPRFTSTGPVQEPPPLASFVSPVGPAVLWASAEPVRWVQGELLKFRPLDFGPSIKMMQSPWVSRACVGAALGGVYEVTTDAP
jgi:hypothetical protein